MKKVILSCILSALTVAVFAQSNQSTKAKSSEGYGKNILAFNPVHLVSSDFVGVGFSYERIVNDFVGIKLPVMIGINNNYYNIGIEAKLYPTKNTGPVKYAIAPALMVGLGSRQYENYLYTGGGVYINQTVRESASHVGFLLNQTLNVTISKEFYIGLDGGLGINYYDEAANNYNNDNSNLSFLAQLHFGLGYRF